MTQQPGSPATPRLAALRFRDFRLLWLGQLVSMIGSQMQVIAINWQVYRLLSEDTYTLSLLGRDLPLDGSALGLGVLGLVRIIPIILLSLIGGAVADVHDRRTVMIWAQSAAAVNAALLAAVTLSGGVSVWMLYALTATGSAISAFDQPARQSIVPHVVPPHLLTNAVSLNTVSYDVGAIIGPALGGVLIAKLDIGAVYGLNGLSYVAVLAAVLLMSYRGSAADGQARGKVSLEGMVEGWRFTRGSRLIWSTMLLDFFATFFSSARTMLPIISGDLLGLGPGGYGVLSTAQSVGSILAGVVMSLRRQIHRQGVVLLASIAAYGLATALFGLSTVFVLSYLLFALTGVADTVSTVIRGTIRQMMTPDHLRGRMVGVNMIFFMGGPQLGELEAGLVAAVFGVSFSVFTGGLATVLLTAWIAWRYPGLRRYTADAYKEPAERVSAGA